MLSAPFLYSPHRTANIHSCNTSHSTPPRFSHQTHLSPISCAITLGTPSRKLWSPPDPTPSNTPPPPAASPLPPPPPLLPPGIDTLPLLPAPAAAATPAAVPSPPAAVKGG